jgi:hypothetical protein
MLSASAQTTKSEDIKEVKGIQMNVPQKFDMEQTLFLPQTTLVSNPSRIANSNGFENKKTHKADYARYGYFWAGFDLAVIKYSLDEDDDFWNGGLINLFPDSLAKIVRRWYGSNSDDTLYDAAMYHGTGYVFDPYSFFWSVMQDKDLFEESEWLYHYKIDTLGIPSSYLLANYDPQNPDSLIIYLTCHDYYVENRSNYLSEYYVFSSATEDKTNPYYGSTMCRVGRSIADAATAKGLGGYPLAYELDVTHQRTKRVAFALTNSHAVAPFTDPDSLNYVRYRVINVPVDFEVPAGNVVSVVYQFQPGYTYNEGDTLRLYHIDKDLDNKITSIEQRFNTYAVADYGFDTNMTNKFVYSLDKGGGLNSHFMEDIQDRYNWWDGVDEPGHFEHVLKDSNGNAVLRYYPYNYYAYPMGLLYLAVSNEQPLPRQTDVAVNEFTDNLLYSVYPNPANDQIAVSLKNAQKADIEVVNILGQVVKNVSTNQQKTVIDIADLTAGMYILKVYQDKQIQSTKIIKR